MHKWAAFDIYSSTGYGPSWRLVGIADSVSGIAHVIEKDIEVSKFFMTTSDYAVLGPATQLGSFFVSEERLQEIKHPKVQEPKDLTASILKKIEDAGSVRVLPVRPRCLPGVVKRLSGADNGRSTIGPPRCSSAS